ncbi:TIGR00725 family protein [Merismopedia glauca]|uniref:TIGR00725 family protein n=1 Tax=Merismopedia glauca CCAP 1448/3 TaxID=1296344 RepID=A0A2T1C2Y1_9CYAN|nr:TIGR00725 family protein [Merismopedia glauca]PSB02612.1 TIGR00725 family protein [Merismopedia glauca CCAP 1448/3]
MSQKVIIGVMGPGTSATQRDLELASELGQLIAESGWVLLTGGRNQGVMEAASRGAKAAGGLTIGILPGSDRSGVSEFVDVAIVTDLGHARNNVNVLSSDAIVVCGMGLGTASEVALALKQGKRVILLGCDLETQKFWQKLSSLVLIAETPPEAMQKMQNLLSRLLN